MFRVTFALFPLIASTFVQSIWVGEVRHAIGAQEFLFFTFMLSAITLGDLYEIIRKGSWTVFVALIVSTLLSGTAWCILLYGMNIYANEVYASNERVSATLLLHSKIMAIAFFTLGTLVQIVLGKLETTSWKRSNIQ